MLSPSTKDQGLIPCQNSLGVGGGEKYLAFEDKFGGEN